MINFTATAGALPGLSEGGGGFSLWQSLGGLILVFGLLILCLKLLGRFNRRHNPGQSSLLTVWPLGPKREIQILRLGDEVHYIYRHEGAMVLLKQESLTQWERSRAGEAAPTGAGGLGRFFGGRLSRSGLSPLVKPGLTADLSRSLES